MFKMHINICSYNCNSLRKAIDIVRQLLAENDILFLQETLIFATDIEFMRGIDPDFNSVISSCTRREGIDTGRPIGGLIIFWRKHLINEFIRPVYNQDNFIIRVIPGQTDTLFLNSTPSSHRFRSNFA